MLGEVFAAIDVGSYEMALKVFELSSKSGVKELDHVRHRMDIGSETYATGSISHRHVEELIRILLDFKQIMKSYGVTHYQAYGTSAVRETRDIVVVQDLIEQRTGIHIDVLSNSEQRFLDYKSIALKHNRFKEIIEKPTAIVDIGGGSIQISLFEKDKLVATQNLKTGVLRIHTTMEEVHATRLKYMELVSELVNSQLSVFSKLYLKDRIIDNIIVIDDYVSPLIQRMGVGTETEGHVTSQEYHRFLKQANSVSDIVVSKKLNIPEDNVPLLYVSGVIIKCVLEATKASDIWAPGMTLCDGIAYEYADKKKFIRSQHDFEQDIVACAQNISKRFMGSKSRRETLQKIALTIFDSTSELHGLSSRDRLLLQIATILHDCGKYISVVYLGDCSYNIIMSTEIIGLSHIERLMVANIVRYNHEEFEYYGSKSRFIEGLSKEDYLRVTKLTAILRVANGLDRTHKQKFKDVKVAIKDGEMIINVDTRADITLEKGLFSNRAGFFEEVFGIRPVIRQKKQI
ncbi:Ppx/GppA phosphatase family protein [Butyrivibrio sp. YAB3001]|uniref:Ppx/GppA phosphatase family protein n=1 Tax=Butyrivibrio sp. YAB3001 TaxID=1520812 RepID=UPI0008F64105|nr:HD domain-containing protein [Butyrivibrio sp. YAB3001]SFB70942.1 exopolyphosphatase / guanosine-5'-triphosphate,3'-diphosphate pyrophosphatase [Butyrivibrio sp. YAB3001]